MKPDNWYLIRVLFPLFRRLKGFRHIFSRFDKLDAVFMFLFILHLSLMH